MKKKIELWLCESKGGRVAIHLISIALYGGVAWHIAGIAREFKGV
jgi:hypothetical protein